MHPRRNKRIRKIICCRDAVSAVISSFQYKENYPSKKIGTVLFLLLHEISGWCYSFAFFLDTRNEFFEMMFGVVNVHFGRLGLDFGVGYNHHDVGIGREGIDDGPEA